MRQRARSIASSPNAAVAFGALAVIAARLVAARPAVGRSRLRDDPPPRTLRCGVCDLPSDAGRESRFVPGVPPAQPGEGAAAPARRAA
jgi:hypothetical protein